jgi:hypothetical protein
MSPTSVLTSAHRMPPLCSSMSICKFHAQVYYLLQIADLCRQFPSQTRGRELNRCAYLSEIWLIEIYMSITISRSESPSENFCIHNIADDAQPTQSSCPQSRLQVLSRGQRCMVSHDGPGEIGPGIFRRYVCDLAAQRDWYHDTADSLLSWCCKQARSPRLHAWLQVAQPCVRR